MIVIDGRFDVRLISHRALAQYMEYRGQTVRQLADKADCSRALVGHLRSGKRATCRPETARKIEKALDAPQGSLFVGKLSLVSREVGPRRAA